MNKNFKIEQLETAYSAGGNASSGANQADMITKINELVTTCLYLQARIDKLELQVEHLEAKSNVGL